MPILSCPLNGLKKCEQDQCALWDDVCNMCCIKGIRASLYDIRVNLEIIVDKMTEE